METRLETFGRLEVLACAGIDASIVQRSAAKGAYSYTGV